MRIFVLRVGLRSRDEFEFFFKIKDKRVSYILMCLLKLVFFLIIF